MTLWLVIALVAGQQLAKEAVVSREPSSESMDFIYNYVRDDMHDKNISIALIYAADLDIRCVISFPVI